MHGCEYIRTIHSETLSIKVWIDGSSDDANDVEVCLQGFADDLEYHDGIASRLYNLFCSVTRVEVMDDCGCGESFSEG